MRKEKQRQVKKYAQGQAVDRWKSQEQNSVAAAHHNNRLHMPHIFKTSREHWMCSLGEGQSSWNIFAPCIAQRSLGSLANTPAATAVWIAVFHQTRTILVCQNIIFQSKHGKGECQCCISLDSSFHFSGYEPDTPLSLQHTVKREDKAIQPSVPLSGSISLSCEQPGTLCKALMRPKKRLT